MRAVLHGSGYGEICKCSLLLFVCTHVYDVYAAHCIYIYYIEKCIYTIILHMRLTLLPRDILWFMTEV